MSDMEWAPADQPDAHAMPPLSAVGKRRYLLDWADHLGIVSALRPLHDRRRTSLVILAYHRIMPIAAAETYPLDLDLISATPAQFEWQMEYLRRHMTPVSLAQVIAHLDGGAPLPRAAIAVTLDDGYFDTYRYAFPILRRHSIPATVFVTTGNVDSGEPFWFELAAYLVLRVEPGALESDELPQRYPHGNTMPERRESLRALHEVLKGLPEARRAAILGDWVRRFAHIIDTRTLELSRPISWPQILEMSAAGIDFGSHTVNHPNLTQLTADELTWELEESRRVLEERLRRPIGTLAYPIGTSAAINAAVTATARRTGFGLAVSYRSGANWAGSLDRYELRRHGVDPAMTHGYFRAMTRLPAWVA